MKYLSKVLFVSVVFATTHPQAASAGRLGFVGNFADPENIYHLRGAHGVAVSPDGRNVYVASFDDNALVVLGRDILTGGLTYSQAHLDQRAEVQGLFRPVSVVVSPDGANVYVGAFFGDAVATFARDPASGQLQFLEALFGGALGQRGLTQVHGLALSPDGRELFVASYGDNAVTVLHRDESSGRLSVLQTLREVSDGGEVIGLVRPTAVAVSPDGSHLFVTAGGSGSLVHLRRDTKSGAFVSEQTFFDGVDDVSGLDGAISVAVSPDGQDVYGLGTNGVAHFRDMGGGRFRFIQAFSGEEVVGLGEGSGPTEIAVSPQGSAVLLTRGGDDTLVLLERNALTGALQVVDLLSDGQNGVDGLAGAAALSLDSSGQWVYVAAQYDDAVSIFRRWPRCAGDCNEDRTVTVDELVRAVHALLEEQQPLTCWQADYSGDGRLTVDEIVRSVREALGECAAPSP